MRIERPSETIIREAAIAIRHGKLVVMPTETVYGLAADAMNPVAVQRIFAAKGRPSDNPLIVHVASTDQVEMAASAIPPVAQRLMRTFWPGPLTLVLPKRDEVPDLTTAGLDTVAVRMPNHHIARQLIREAGTVIAAPSANPFMGLSPTRAENVDPTLAAHAEMILDGGPCQIGLESTVIDCTVSPVRILRPGWISQSDIESILGIPVEMGQDQDRKSPGQYARHYAPRTPVSLVARLDPSQTGLLFGPSTHERQITMPSDPSAYGMRLYDALNQLDSIGLDTIYVENPPETPEWDAIWDRLKKASCEI